MEEVGRYLRREDAEFGANCCDVLEIGLSTRIFVPPTFSPEINGSLCSHGGLGHGEEDTEDALSRRRSCLSSNALIVSFGSENKKRGSGSTGYEL